ncbi:hydroxymethylglutaryl-CoA lyase [Kitasatospora atroaurantiaca]|uniref:Hydroxymethylglutaryl-CoA lyase n=1 Tax=Kitasatospora atroaurantiaca TaxID=285545 RepID=A0A561EP67_9ACTN|nr:hydroxymethylglutaryl-CoA lyase [Kitasatospora atroaurantiaca]TWE17392.1 hydroxymethylglutaryl-CoA lyase [Kitasatospora atroaurantiaca]
MTTPAEQISAARNGAPQAGSHEPDALELGLPAPVREPGLPARVRIHEVGPRDGLQNESSLVPVEVKAEFITRLAATGLRTVEATSFVHPKWVPQLADAEDLMPQLGELPGRHPGLRLPVLVPNERGLDRALAHHVTDIAVFASATETFARRNLNRSADEVLTMFRPVVERAAEAGVPTRGYLSMCFGDPWEGPVPQAQVIDFGVRLLELGCTELSLGDTIGVATPGQVTALLEGFARAGVPTERIAVHFHDTYGQALANTLAALRSGVTTVDASAGGLGGCPYAKSATGNLATEDLVWMLHGLGIETGVDLRALVAASGWMAQQLGRPSPSRAVQALYSHPA